MKDSTENKIMILVESIGMLGLLIASLAMLNSIDTSQFEDQKTIAIFEAHQKASTVAFETMGEILTHPFIVSIGIILIIGYTWQYFLWKNIKEGESE